METRGTLVYVHGASDRASQVADHVARIERQLPLAGLALDVVASRWGEAAGAKLDDLELALPVGPAQPLSRAEPRAELGQLARIGEMDDTWAVPQQLHREADQLLDICMAEGVASGDNIRLSDGSEVSLAEACRVSAGDVAASEMYARARTTGVPEPMLVAAAGRAVAAGVAARAAEPAGIEETVELRIAEVVLGAALATMFAGYLGVDVGPALKRWATDVILPHRARLMRDIAPGPADILLYQRHGDPIRRVVASSVSDALARGGPVVALGNSLGGIILVDTLSQPDTPRPDLLVTIGTQAALLATFGALGDAAQHGAPFQPWLNIYDRRDLLGFAAERVWPEAHAISDVEVDLGVGFPDSHGATYLDHRPVYDLMRGHLASRPG